MLWFSSSSSTLWMNFPLASKPPFILYVFLLSSFQQFLFIFQLVFLFDHLSLLSGPMFKSQTPFMLSASLIISVSLFHKLLLEQFLCPLQISAHSLKVSFSLLYQWSLILFLHPIYSKIKSTASLAASVFHFGELIKKNIGGLLNYT